MEPAIVDMIRDQFKVLNEKCDDIQASIKEHVEQDQAYWQKIDKQEGAIGVWKWIAGLGGGSGVMAALAQYFGKH